MFRLIIVLVMAGLIALAFYLGWVHITTTSTQDQSESSVTLSINKAKIKESVGALRGALGKKGDKSNGIAETTVHGKVETLAARQITVKTGDDQMVTAAIAHETEVEGNPGPGDAVTVSYITVDNRHIATSIRKESRPLFRR